MISKDGFPFEIWRVQTSINQSIHLRCAVLKASAEPRLNCPTLQHGVRRLPQITAALPPVWKFGGCNVTSLQVAAESARTTGEELGGSTSQRRLPHSRETLPDRAQCALLPFSLFLLSTGTLHPAFRTCNWDNFLSWPVLWCRYPGIAVARRRRL